MADITYLPNLLDSYNLPTYHIKFYMLPDTIDPNNYAVTAPSTGIIIAESGVTSIMSIDDLQVESYVSLTSASKNTSQTSINFTITEIGGASLFDKMFAASKALNIHNYFKVPYYLEVSFRANKKNNQSQPTQIPNLIFRWPIAITNVSTSVNTSGAIYNFESFHFGDSPVSSSMGHIIDKAFSYSEGKTVKDVLDNLSLQLNRRAVEKAVTGLTEPDTFSIQIDSTLPSDYLRIGNTTSPLGDMLIVSPDEVSVQGGRNKPIHQTSANTDKRTIPIERDISILDAINRIVCSTKEYQKFSKRSNDSANLVDNPDAIKQLHRISNKVELGPYDKGRGDYQKHYIFKVYPFLVPQLQASPNDTNATPADRLNSYAVNDLLEKEYKYIYTGENDQVIEFDISFNYGWFVNMPPQGGFFTNYNTVAEGEQFSVKYKKILEIRDMISRYLNLTDTDSSKRPSIFTDVGAAEQSVIIAEQISQAIQDAELPEEEEAQLNRLLSLAKKERIPDPVPDLGNTNSPTNITSRYVSDYRLSTALLKAKDNTSFRQYPLSYGETDIEATVTGQDSTKGNEGDKGPGKQHVNSLFQQAFSGRSGDLISIELKIKGDPYWLGEPRSAGPIEPATVTNIGQVGFTFSLRAPEFPPEISETTTLRPSIMSGTYCIRKIEHNFSVGLFTQILYATIDPLLGTEKIDLPTEIANPAIDIVDDLFKKAEIAPRIPGST